MIVEQSLENQKEKRDLLIFFYDKTREESAFLRERQYKIFTWTSSLLIGLIGLLLVTDSATNFSFNINNPAAKGIISLAIIGFVFFSVNWQQRNRKWISENGFVINQIQELLHCFDKGYFDSSNEMTLFPIAWRFSATANRKNFFQRLFYANYISATIFLGLMTILMVWVYNP